MVFQGPKGEVRPPYQEKLLVRWADLTVFAKIIAKYS